MPLRGGYISVHKNIAYVLVRPSFWADSLDELTFTKLLIFMKNKNITLILLLLMC